MEEQTTRSPLAALLDAIPFPAAILDREGRAVYVNRAGAPPADAAAEGPCPRTAPPGRRTGFLETISRTGEARFFTEEVSGTTGERCRLRRLCIPVVTGNRHVDRFALITVGCATTPDTLSTREREVFDLLGQGFTTHEIAARLLVSPKTVESYRARIKTKLGIDHHAELLRRAVQWVEGSSNDTVEPGARPVPHDAAWLDVLVDEIRSPLAAIVGLADTLASEADHSSGDVAALISRSTQQLIQRLDVLTRDAHGYAAKAATDDGRPRRAVRGRPALLG